MANEFICSECGGDGTRCRCHTKRKSQPPWKSPDEKRIEDIRKNNIELQRLAKEMGVKIKPIVEV